MWNLVSKGKKARFKDRENSKNSFGVTLLVVTPVIRGDDVASMNHRIELTS
jgi:hypothetical protein